MKCKGRRAIALLLVLLMVLTLLPVTAFGLGSSDDGDEEDDGATDQSGNPYSAPYTEPRFVRFTIVGFPNGIDQWTRGTDGGVKVYGSVNLTDSTKMINDASKVIRWADTNAVSAQAYTAAGEGDWASYYKYKTRRTSVPGQEWHIESFQDVTGVTMPNVSGIEGSTGYSENGFLDLFTDPDPVTGENKANAVFDKLVARIVPNMTAKMFEQGKDINGAEGHIDYRLVIEPGVYTGSGTFGKYLALTARDLIAETMNKPYADPESTEWMWNREIKHVMYGLYSTRDEIAVQKADKSYEVQGDPMFKAVTNADINWNRTISYFKKEAPSKGFALSIINPGDIGDTTEGEPLDNYVGRVNIYIPTEAELTTTGVNDSYGVDTYSYVGTKGGLSPCCSKHK